MVEVLVVVVGMAVVMVLEVLVVRPLRAFVSKGGPSPPPFVSARGGLRCQRGGLKVKK